MKSTMENSAPRISWRIVLILNKLGERRLHIALCVFLIPYSRKRYQPYIFGDTRLTDVLRLVVLITSKYILCPKRKR